MNILITGSRSTSKGTLHTISTAAKMGIVVYLIPSDDIYEED